MSGFGGTKMLRCVTVLVIGMSLAGGVAACAPVAEGVPRPPSTVTSQRPTLTFPAKDQDVLAVEARNYAELQQRLAQAPGAVLLADSGPADGPGVGFTKPESTGGLVVSAGF